MVWICLRPVATAHTSTRAGRANNPRVALRDRYAPSDFKIVLVLDDMATPSPRGFDFPGRAESNLQ